jgi:hypothetical protein
MLAANEIKVSTNELVQILTRKLKEFHLFVLFNFLFLFFFFSK